MKKIKAILATIGVLSFALLPAVGFARLAVAETLDINNNITCGTEAGAINGSCAPPAGSTSVTDIVKRVINILSWVVGVISVIMIIVAGFMFVTSAGDSTKAGNARKTITYAVIGLVVAALAQVIVRFVLSNATAT